MWRTPTQEVSAGPKAKQEAQRIGAGWTAAKQDAKRGGAPDSPVPGAEDSQVVRTVNADERPRTFMLVASWVYANSPADEEYPHQKGGNLHQLFEKLTE